MTIEELTERIEHWIGRTIQSPMARVLDTQGLRANHITLVGLTGCVGAAVLVAQEALILGGLLFLIASALDAIDGSLARHQGAANRLGAWLDAYTGTVGESCIYIALLFFSTDVGILRLVGVAAASSFFVSHVKAVAGEYDVLPDWRDARIIGRTIRILIVSVGLTTAGLLGNNTERVVAFTLLLLLAFNILVLVHRTLKIVRAGLIVARTDTIAVSKIAAFAPTATDRFVPSRAACRRQSKGVVVSVAANPGEAQPAPDISHTTKRHMPQRGPRRNKVAKGSIALKTSQH